MSWFHGLRHRIRTVLHPTEYERELRDEMGFHESLDAQQERDPSRARRRFGNRTYYQEETREMTWLRWLDVLRQDLGYAWRSVRRTPGFTAMVVVTLALGLGVNAATFAVLDRLYLRAPSGVMAPDELRRVWFETSPERSYDGKGFISSSVSYPEYRVVADASGRPESFALYGTEEELTLLRGQSREQVRAVFASATYFTLLGVRPALGRLYTAIEDSVGQGARVVVASHRFWTQRLGGDTAAIGEQLNVEYQNYTLIGVLEPEFEGLELQASDLWFPTASAPVLRAGWWTNPNVNGFRAFYRPAQPAATDAFDRKATLLYRDLQRNLYPKSPDTLSRVISGPLYGGGPGKVAQEMLISSRLGAVSLIILVIACANVINLLLARAERRKREIAVRLALGVSRGRLVRLLTTETLLLAVIAGSVSLLAAWWGGATLRALLLPDVVWHESALHWRVVVFAIGTALLAGLVAGVIPATQASKPGLTAALKEGTPTASARRSRLRTTMVITQAALSIVLLAGAALFVRSLQNVQGLDIGYEPDHLLFGRVAFAPGQRPPATIITSSMEQLQERLSGRPGIEATSLAAYEPMRAFSFLNFYWDADSSYSLRPNSPTYIPVGPEFFRTVGMSIVEGSTFQDGPGAPREVVINQVMAKRMWADVPALGRCIRFIQRNATCYTVVGVVENARQADLIEEEPVPVFYLPVLNQPTPERYAGTLIVRTTDAASAGARQELTRALAATFPSGDPIVRSMSQNLLPEYRPWRLGASLFTAFGLLALGVAIIGIYSSVSYGVTQRTHEFGVRAALGARMTDVLRQVVGEGLRVAAVGVIAGIALSLAAGQLVAALLYGVEPGDPAVLLGVSLVLLVVAGLAAFIPAWRASRVDPLVALRSD